MGEGVNFINTAAKSIDPKNNVVETMENQKINYEYLILCSGTHARPELTKGLTESLRDENVPVATNYILEYAIKMN